MPQRSTTALAVVCLLTTPSWSQEAMPAWMPDEPRAAWDGCMAHAEAAADGWLGWKRDFGNGYGDSFAFYDGTFTELASLLVTTRAIDGIAWEETRWCFRPDGSLAVIATSMNAPLLDPSGGETGGFATRQGWVAVAEGGAILDTKGWVTRSGEEAEGAVDDPALQLARGCDPVALFLRVDEVQLQMEATLGDIEGKRPELEPPLHYDWCGALTAAD